MESSIGRVPLGAGLSLSTLEECVNSGLTGQRASRGPGGSKSYLSLSLFLTFGTHQTSACEMRADVEKKSWDTTVITPLDLP